MRSGKRENRCFYPFEYCATVSLAELASANIVGYYTTDAFEVGNAMGTPTFTNVTGEELALQDILPVGENVPNGLDGVTFIQIQKLTAGAKTDGSIWFWMDYEEEDWLTGETITKYGWYDMLGTELSTMTFKPGEGFWAKFPTGSSASFQYAGQVPDKDVYTTVNNGNTAMGNPFPYSLEIVGATEMGITPVGENVPNGLDGVTFIQFQKLTADAKTDGSIWFWMDYEEEDWLTGETITKYGWYDMLGTVECDVTLNPGEGIWVKSPAECQFKFTAKDL